MWQTLSQVCLDWLDVPSNPAYFTFTSDTNLLQTFLKSSGIKNIEAELGVTLFDRSGKTFKLTESGASAVGQFRAIVESVNDLHARLHDISSLETGSLLIGLPPVISPVFFPRVVAPFKKKAS